MGYLNGFKYMYIYIYVYSYAVRPFRSVETDIPTDFSQRSQRDLSINWPRFTIDRY